MCIGRVQLYVSVRVISQMIAFCARSRKYAKLRQRLPPFWTGFSIGRGKSSRNKKKECTLFFP